MSEQSREDLPCMAEGLACSLGTALSKKVWDWCVGMYSLCMWGWDYCVLVSVCLCVHATLSVCGKIIGAMLKRGNVSSFPNTSLRLLAVGFWVNLNKTAA